jgi:hypothetical protein
MGLSMGLWVCMGLDCGRQGFEILCCLCVGDTYLDCSSTRHLLLLTVAVGAVSLPPQGAGCTQNIN